MSGEERDDGGNALPTPSPKLAEIRKLYFSTTRKTIQRDFDRAIDLLKSMETDTERERATVYMQGLAEMRKEFGFGKRNKPEP